MTGISHRKDSSGSWNGAAKADKGAFPAGSGSANDHQLQGDAAPACDRLVRTAHEGATISTGLNRVGEACRVPVKRSEKQN
jgi:hypothetical protein